MTRTAPLPSSLPHLVGALLCSVSLGLSSSTWAQPAVAPASLQADVDAIFSGYTSQTPGCAVGVSVDGAMALQRGYGMADLEHDVPITPETIFEAGSVSKQFTAAAVLLLEADGRLRLDEPITKYIPEVPTTTPPVTIRQMLQHTSGLRDWGSLAGISGWPRTTRVHTHAHVLDSVSRQAATNFIPGTHWSYSNTGYNLAAVLVARVSGLSFAEFTRQRLFVPLGLRHTSWRDDHRAIVKGRALAYEDTGNGFLTEMPFESVHGNGGLLTTVSDLLAWTSYLHRPSRPTDAAWIGQMQIPISFSGTAGRGYGLGLMIDTRRGVRQVDHSGSTAGYLAHLAGYPDQRIAVAVLCNVTSGQATQRAYRTADVYLARAITLQDPVGATATLSRAERNALAGLYRSRLDGRPLRLLDDGEALRMAGGARLLPQSARTFASAGGQQLQFIGGDTVRVSDRYDEVTYDRTTEATPSMAELQALVGTYRSAEVETSLRLTLDGGQLIVRRGVDTRVPLTPLYRDAFDAASLGTLLVQRAVDGTVTGISVVQDRVWHLPFTRETAASRPRPEP